MKIAFLFMTSYSNHYTKKSKTKSTLIQCECTHMPALGKKTSSQSASIYFIGCFFQMPCNLKVTWGSFY